MSTEQTEKETIPDYLSYRSQLEETVLSEFSTREKSYAFRFNGLRRVLKDVHQQKLTRALERLQEDQLIERHQDGGYTLDSNYYDYLKDYYEKQKAFSRRSVSDSIHTQQNFIATRKENDLPVQQLTEKLAGKYFSYYRFIGHYYSNGEGRLEWIHAEDGSRILISAISSDQILVSSRNVSQNAIRKFLHIIQHILIEYNIYLAFTEETGPEAN
ncbi:MAG: hypothetical protein EAX86_12900 [Candidatus Heimdallarchaeota archaeon]|nr:hypothetical protein [Candidatus Heimdallarchaeota archaeon]